MLDDTKFTVEFYYLLWKTQGSSEQPFFFFCQVSDNSVAINILSTQWNSNKKNKLFKVPNN